MTFFYILTLILEAVDNSVSKHMLYFSACS